MRHCYIFDIDGTLADCTHRLHHIKEKPKNWDAFFNGCADDAPIDHVIGVLTALIESGCQIMFVSGRPERCRADTLAWIERYVSVFARSLYMRKDGDFRDDDIVKKELLDQLRSDGWEPIMAFDDRSRVVDMWRANGVPCAQVAPGDF